MKFQIISDIHLEFHADNGESWLEWLEPAADALIVGGDLCYLEHLEHVLRMLSAKFKEVIFVAGNHEYYGSSSTEVSDALAKAVSTCRNIHWLDCSSVTLGGIRIFGGTLWFQDSPLNAGLAGNMADFAQIDKFVPWVYEENARFKRLLCETDVVVTHHLPHMKSVHSTFAEYSLNCFFVCDMGDAIESLKPKLWIHGHTHLSMDYMLRTTRVVANPMGYPFALNPQYDESLVIEV